ncbi:hypothetical protein SAMD00019534_084890, partial [Acytostelium subglobosum LB1]|uniref:hypothetical protein n=1 Tax=Acytostelium subglobosum LB1 TaxID=1410327 RepID=UPI000645212D
MFRTMYKGTLPPIKDPGSKREREDDDNNNDNSEHRDALINDDDSVIETALWSDYFDSRTDVNVEGRGTFRVYECNTNVVNDGHLVVFVHGGGHTSLSWALAADLMKKHMNPQSQFRLMAYDARAHGETKAINNEDLSIGALVDDLVTLINQYAAGITANAGGGSPLKVVLVGHSMGGAVVVRASKSGRVLNQCAVVVIDVVEGTAMSALPAMRSILARRPAHFKSESDAIKWSIKSDNLRNIESARVSIPSQIRQSGDKYVWITDLAPTERFWSEWFQGLSKEFLESRVAKLLILAGSDRLDKEMTIGQMMGKFQLALFPTCGHVIQEDNPKATADTLLEFLKR